MVVPQLLLNYEHAAAALALSRAALRDLVYKARGPTVTQIGRRPCSQCLILKISSSGTERRLDLHLRTRISGPDGQSVAVLRSPS
jgi:hypothetical protein